MARSANQPPKSVRARVTSKEVAAKAAEALADAEAGERERSLAGSALSQAEPEATVETVFDPGVAAAEHLRRVVDAIDALIAESQGVYGLHRNGDMAPWPELQRAGRCEGWLLAVDEARDFLGSQS